MKIRLEDIRSFIQEPYLSRGKEYFSDGLVKLLVVKSNEVKARIAGSSVYTVLLTFKNNALGGRCSCPAFVDFGPCKHMAATCFALLNTSQPHMNEDAAYRFDEVEGLEKHLRTLKKTELIELILDAAGKYPEILDDYDFGESFSDY